MRTWCISLLTALVLWPLTAWAGGWYLLTPPVVEESKRGELPSYAVERPLREWQQVRSFDSAEECQKDRQQSDEFLRRQSDEGVMPKDMADWERLKVALSRCVGSDDPRLAVASGGWYLMSPRSVETESFVVMPPPDPGRPLHEWETIEIFDSAQECNRAWDRQVKLYESLYDEAPKGGELAAAYQRGVSGAFHNRCVATNSPQLGESDSRSGGQRRFSGWYWLTPPPSWDGSAKKPPLREWTVGTRFDSAKECEDRMALYWKSRRKRSAENFDTVLEDEGVKEMLRQSPEFGRAFVGALFGQFFKRLISQCVATDDPRLGPLSRRP